MSSNNVIVSDRFDNLRGELPGAAVSWAWLINGIGLATLQVAYNHPKASEYYLGMSNIVRIKYPGLRTWIGRIDGLSWGNGVINVSARSAECLLQKRRTAETRTFFSTPGGVCGKALVDEANAVSKTYVRTDSDLIWQGGALQTFTCYHDDVYERLAQLALDTGAEWWVDENRYLRWQQTQGQQKPNVALIDGVNLAEGSGYSEMSVEMINDWKVIGYGEDWGQKPKESARDQTSIDRYGLREGTEDAQDLPNVAALQIRAAALLGETGQPLQFFDLLVVNRNDIWSELNLGDWVRVESDRWGWNGVNEMVRIVGIEVNEMAGVMHLAVQRSVS